MGAARPKVLGRAALSQPPFLTEAIGSSVGMLVAVIFHLLLHRSFKICRPTISEANAIAQLPLAKKTEFEQRKSSSIIFAVQFQPDDQVDESVDVHPTLIDGRLLTALAHDTRTYALLVFSERPASTKEIAAELGVSVSAVWYHVQKLLSLGCIEEVDVKRRRGAHERFFIATRSCYFDVESWSTMPAEKKHAYVMRILRMIAGDLDEAMRSNTVDTDDNHLSHTPLILDRMAWKEATELLEETLVKLLEIRKQAGRRVAEGESDAFRAAVSIMQFELPPRKPA